MQIAPVSMTNQYRTNRSNTKHSTSPNFGHKMGNYPTNTIKYISDYSRDRIFAAYGGSFGKFKQDLINYKERRLDISCIINEWKPKFEALGNEAVEGFNNFINRLNIPLKDNKLEITMGTYCSQADCGFGTYDFPGMIYYTLITYKGYGSGNTNPERTLFCDLEKLTDMMETGTIQALNNRLSNLEEYYKGKSATDSEVDLVL